MASPVHGANFANKQDRQPTFPKNPEEKLPAEEIPCPGTQEKHHACSHPKVANQKHFHSDDKVSYHLSYLPNAPPPAPPASDAPASPGAPEPDLLAPSAPALVAPSASASPAPPSPPPAPSALPPAPCPPSGGVSGWQVVDVLL